MDQVVTYPERWRKGREAAKDLRGTRLVEIMIARPAKRAVVAATARKERLMRAVVRRGTRLVFDEIAELTPGPGQTLVKTLCCGICGSTTNSARS